MNLMTPGTLPEIGHTEMRAAVVVDEMEWVEGCLQEARLKEGLGAGKKKLSVIAAVVGNQVTQESSRS